MAKKEKKASIMIGSIGTAILGELTKTKPKYLNSSIGTAILGELTKTKPKYLNRRKYGI